jgi:hypothetical protein
VVKRQYLPRIDAVGMLPTASTGGYGARPDVDAAGIDGVYLAGDWIGAGYLADPCFSSAREVAQRIVDRVRPAAMAFAA